MVGKRRIIGLISAALLLGACGDEVDERDPRVVDYPCVDIFLDDVFPFTVEDIDVTGFGNDFQPAVGVGGFFEDITYGWVASFDGYLRVSMMWSEGMEDEELDYERRLHRVETCGGPSVRSGVMGTQFDITVESGQMVILIVEGCQGDCILEFGEGEPPWVDARGSRLDYVLRASMSS